jgi:hypothetical protein
MVYGFSTISQHLTRAPRILRSRDSSVGIATGYGLDGPGSIPAEALSPIKRQGREADHSPPSSSKVKKGGATLPLVCLHGIVKGKAIPVQTVEALRVVRG